MITDKWRLLLPWGAAAFLFTPRYRLMPEDAVVSMLGRARAIAGMIMTIGIAVWYGAYSEFGLEAILSSLVLTAFLAIPISLICMAILVVATKSGSRRAVVRQLTWPLLTLGAFVVAMAGLVLFNAGGASVLMRYDADVPLSGKVAGGVFGLWGLIFVFRSIYLVSQYWFNAVDGHPYLQPLTAVWMGWVLTINTLAFQPHDGSIPARIGLALPIISALVTTGFAAFEAHRTRQAIRYPAPPPVTPAREGSESRLPAGNDSMPVDPEGSASFDDRHH